jgi:hypothetical protein
MILDKHGEAAVGPGWVRGFAGRFRIWRRSAAAGHRRESTSTPSTSKIAPLEYRHASSSQPPPGGPTVAAPGALNRATPAQAYTARAKAHPAGPRFHRHYRVRRDRIDTTGVVTLRYNSRLRHIGLGRAHAGKRIYLLVADLYTRIIDAETDQLLRELTLDPNRDYQPLGRPPAPPKKT